jgi:hypothetical protein
MSRIALLFLLMSVTSVASSNEVKGTLCLGENLAKPLDEHTDRLYLRIDDSPRIYFVRPFIRPRVIAQNLDIHKDYMVRVYFDNKEAQSWKLNFSKLKTNSVLVWRASGAWRMEPNEASSCK